MRSISTLSLLLLLSAAQPSSPATALPTPAPEEPAVTQPTEAQPAEAQPADAPAAESEEAAGAASKTATPAPIDTLARAEAVTPERMSLPACLKTAYEKHPDVQRVKAQIRRAEQDAKSTRGAYGPTLSFEANVIVWDEEMVSSFSMGDTSVSEIPPPESQFDGWLLLQLAGLTDMGDIVMRDQVTWGTKLLLTQPLTPLYQVYKGYEAKKKLVDQTQAHSRTVRHDIGFEVAKAYYAARQAEEYVVIAGSAVDQLNAHLTQARAFFEQGLISKSDVLKVEVELANVLQQQIQARAGRLIARANLATQMGLDPRTAVAPEAESPTTGQRLPVVTMALSAAIEEALSKRSELLELAHGTAAAELGAEASWWNLVPTVALIGQYEHVGGQGSFSKEDSFFAGLFLTWEVWEWGQDYFAAEAADLQVEELRHQRTRIEQLIRLDVTAKYHSLRSAEEAFRVAAVAIRQADEALRIERERFGAQVATSTDVLDAESALTRARSNKTNAYFAYLLARAELLRAMGRPLVAQSDAGDTDG